jgi:hypothetical protein
MLYRYRRILIKVRNPTLISDTNSIGRQVYAIRTHSIFQIKNNRFYGIHKY